MATSKDYLNFILEQLSALEGISYRPMMGEYIIYYREKVAAYICSPFSQNNALYGDSPPRR